MRGGRAAMRCERREGVCTFDCDMLNTQGQIVCERWCARKNDVVVTLNKLWLRDVSLK